MEKTKDLTNKQKEIIKKCYIEEKRGQLYCAKQAKCTQYMVKKFLREEKIPIRDFSQAATVSNINRAKYVNREYFNTESQNMAWLLGFLASDGFISDISNEIVINLSRVDREVLEKIKEELEIEREIKDYTTGNKGYECSSLSWSSVEHKQALAKYNIVYKKTFILKPPYSLNKKYYIDYIRGYFDGDGSINYIENNKSLRWQIAGASKEIIDFIVDTLEEQFNIPKVKVGSYRAKNSTAPIYMAQYSTNATKKIHKILYTDSTLFLKRKKDHFDELVK